jgi:hypothetical protein
VIIDPTAAARLPDSDRVRAWLTEQRVFISAQWATRRRTELGSRRGRGRMGRPVWFEELGRDADAEEADVAGVDTSTI